MQILLNSRNALSRMFSSPLLTGEELSPPLPETVAFLNSKGDFDDAATFDFPNPRVDWTVFFLGEGDFLAVDSEIQSWKTS